VDDLIEEVIDWDTNSHMSDLEVVSRTNEYGSSKRRKLNK
jgi:hypothetical protein